MYKAELYRLQEEARRVEERDISCLKMSDTTLKNLIHWSYNILCLDMYMLYEEYITALATYIKACKDLRYIDVIIDAATEMKNI